MLEDLTIIAIVITVVIILLLVVMVLNRNKKIKDKPKESTKKFKVVEDLFDTVDEYDIDPKEVAIEQKEPLKQEAQVKTEEEIDRTVGPRKRADRRVKQRRAKPRSGLDRRVSQRREIPKDLVVSKDDFKIFTGLRILVAEDNVINQKVIQGLLGSSGIEIIIANNGQEALDILQNDCNFFIILMDSNMPIMDGLEASKRIRENKKYNHIPIIGHSGDTTSDDIKIMKEAGMEELLPKPLSIVELYKTLYAYKKEDKKALNIKRGLEICGGNKEFYLEILNEFVSSYSDSAKTLSSLLLNKQMEEANKLLLDLNGIAANIAAELLYEVTAELRNLIHEGDKLSYMTKCKEYEEHLNNLLDVIKVHL